MGPRSSKNNSYRVNCKELVDYYLDLIKNSGLKATKEFESLGEKCIKCSQKDRQRFYPDKDRYPDIHCVEKTRVKLKQLNDDPNTTYINANYISGYFNKKEYIASQGPLESTVDDFWRMVYETQSKTIIMLTDLYEKSMEKCYPYFPTMKKLVTDNFEIDLLFERDDSFFEIRQFNLFCKIADSEYPGKPKNISIKHFHYKNWPDQTANCQSSTMIMFINQVSLWQKTIDAPMIIHCSAGIGRTGTFIGIHKALNYIVNMSSVNIYKMTYKMRKERCKMVQTEDQYLFIYKTITFAFKYCKRSIIPSEFEMRFLTKDDTNNVHKISKDSTVIINSEYYLVTEHMALREFESNSYDPHYASTLRYRNRKYNRFKLNSLFRRGLIYLYQMNSLDYDEDELEYIFPSGEFDKKKIMLILALDEEGASRMKKMVDKIETNDSFMAIETIYINDIISNEQNKDEEDIRKTAIALYNIHNISVQNSTSIAILTNEAIEITINILSLLAVLDSFFYKSSLIPFNTFNLIIDQLPYINDYTQEMYRHYYQLLAYTFHCIKMNELSRKSSKVTFDFELEDYNSDTRNIATENELSKNIMKKLIFPTNSASSNLNASNSSTNIKKSKSNTITRTSTNNITNNGSSTNDNLNSPNMRSNSTTSSLKKRCSSQNLNL